MLRHLVIFLPGIMGTILQKDGRDVWAPSRQALWTLLETGGDSLRDLRVVGEDGRSDDLGDGIRADRLVRDTVFQLPRLIEHAGYGPLLDQLPEFLEITPGSVHAPQDVASFCSFPMTGAATIASQPGVDNTSWRLSCRAGARGAARAMRRRSDRPQTGAMDKLDGLHALL